MHGQVMNANQCFAHRVFSWILIAAPSSLIKQPFMKSLKESFLMAIMKKKSKESTILQILSNLESQLSLNITVEVIKSMVLTLI